MLTFLMSVYSKEHPNALCEALESIKIQTVLPSQIILVKDGPLTLALESIIDKYVNILPLRLISLNTNVGLAKALNYGLEVVNTEWVARFDTDDICAINRVEQQLLQIKTNNFDLFGSQIKEFNGDWRSAHQTRSVPLVHNDIVSFSKTRNPFNHMTVCFRKSIVDSVGGYPEIKFMEDYALWLKMIAIGARTCNSEKTLVFARIDNGMLERRGGWLYVKSAWEIQHLMLKLKAKKINAALKDGFIRTVISISPVFIRKIIYKKILRNR